MKVTDYIVNALYDVGVETIFGHLGGFNADLVDSIYVQKKQHYVLSYHEQASSFAANAHALVKGKIAVATSSGAPSSCNLISGIANAYFDSVPCLFITGSTHSKALKENKKIRQNAFEEIDMVSLVSDIIKFGVRIDNPNDIAFYLQKAIYIAQEGRKGPVLIDLPYDVARCNVDVDNLQTYKPPNKAYENIDIHRVQALLESSEKPLILLGGGARSEETRNILLQILDKVKIPVVSSLCGLDAIPHNHECFAGFIGHYGNRFANLAVANCDLLIVLGSRLDERQIGGDKAKFASKAKIIRIDIDEVELGRSISGDLSFNSSVESFLAKLSECDLSDQDYSRWIKIVSSWGERYPSYDLSTNTVNANNFLRVLSDYIPDDAIVCSDVGQNQMSVAQAFRLDNKRRLLNSAGYGSMGFSLPAAIGASYAQKGTMIISINGDGGIQMNIQELQTVKRDNLPINIIIFNNSCLGMIRVLQERVFDNRTSASVNGYSTPDYAAIAQAYGIKYLLIDDVGKYEDVRSFLSTEGPSIIEVITPQASRNIPEPGASIDMQTPLLSEEEYKVINEEASWCADLRKE